MNPKFIIKRDDHYEVHYDKHVEFWDLQLTEKQGENPVHIYVGKPL